MLLLWTLAEAASAAESPAPGLGSGNMLSLALSLITVLAVIVLLAWLVRRFQPLARNGNGLQLKAALGVGQKERVIAVEAGDRVLILGITAQQISLLREFSKEEWQDNAGSGGTAAALSFKAILNRQHSPSSQESA